VDGVMIGRAALGNPWMIYRTVRYLETGELIPEPTVREKIEVCLLHLDRLIALKGEHIAVKEMRKHAAWYLKGVRGNAKIRNAINECDTREQLATLLLNFAEEVESKEQTNAQAV
jgi:tRNA-dihydrouridine synthase